MIDTCRAGTCQIMVHVCGGYGFIHALVTQIKITLLETSPKEFVLIKVRCLAGITEKDAILSLPIGFSSLRVQTVTIWTLNANILLVEFISLLTLFEIFNLILQVVDAVVLLLLIIVRKITIFAVNTGFSTCFEMLLEFVI